MRYINYDGAILDAAQEIVKAGNRGLRYGDGLFETMKLSNYSINHWEDHIERLYKGFSMLAFEIPNCLTPDFLLQQIVDLCNKNILFEARVRLMFFRGEGGFLDTANNVHFLIEAFPFTATSSALNVDGYTIGIYQDARKQIDHFSNLKTNNYQAYSMGALHAAKKGWDDSLIMNSNGAICESTIANIFIVKDGTIITPGLDQGCVAGTIRKHFLSKLPQHGFTVTEGEVSLQMILDADELFLTNALQNMKWISRCGDKTYINTTINQIYNALNS